MEDKTLSQMKQDLTLTKVLPMIIYPQNAEKVNGRWAMIGFVALIGAYATTGQIIPGIF